MTSRPRFRWLQRGFLVLGILLLALWSRTSIESRDFQSAESKKLEASLREAERDPTDATASNAAFVGPLDHDPSTQTVPQEGVLGRLEIPRLGISAIVAEGSDASTLRRAVGHIASTALPGNTGNCALAGHRDTFLRGLGAIRADDIIRIVTLEGTYTYHVEWSVVAAPQRVDVLDSTTTRSLTLVTCYPFAFVGHAPQRFVVRARQFDTVADSTSIADPVAIRPHGLGAEGR